LSVDLSIDDTQFTLTLMMTSAIIVKRSVTVTNSLFQDYTHLDDHTEPTYSIRSTVKPLVFPSNRNRDKLDKQVVVVGR